MKKLFKLFIAMLAVCGVACDQLGGLVNGGNGSGNGDEPNTPGTTESVFNITVSDITSTSAYVSVETTSKETYYFDVIEKEYFDQYSDKSVFLTEMIADLKVLYEEYGYTFADALSFGNDGFLYDGNVGLDPNTDYYAFAVAINENGEVRSDITLKAFKTLEAAPSGPSDNEFSVTVSNVTATGALVSVTPSNNDTYYFDIIEKSALDEYGSPLDFALDYIVKLKNSCEASGYTLADILSSGTDSFSYDGYLTPNAEYYAFAFGATADCAITTGVVTVPFTTPELEKGDKVLDNLSYGFFTNYGDYYGSNAANWYIDIYPEEGMDVLILEVQTPLDATDFTGNYPFASTFEANTAVAGFIDDEGYLCGSYWDTLDLNYNISNYAFCKTGNVAISKSGEEYTIALDAVDTDGYKVTANYTGSIEEFVDETANTLSVKKHTARHFCFVPKKSSEKSITSLKFASKKMIAPKKSLIKRDIAR